MVESSDSDWLAGARRRVGRGVSRRGLFALVTATGLSACSSQSRDEKIAKDPYLPQLRADPMYSWRVEGADRQAPAESPVDLSDPVEVRQAQITIYHLVHPDVDIDALYAQAIAARRTAGYDDSRYRVNDSGLRMKCEIVTVPRNRSLLFALSAPEG